MTLFFSKVKQIKCFWKAPITMQSTVPAHYTSLDTKWNMLSEEYDEHFLHPLAMGAKTKSEAY